MDKLNDLTMREVSVIEQKTKTPIDKLGSEDAYKGVLMTALFWVLRKRDNASFSWVQAEDATMTEVAEFLGLNQEDDEDPNSKT